MRRILALAMASALLVPSVVLAQSEAPSTPQAGVEPVPVRFAVAPAAPGDTTLMLLTTERDCGTSGAHPSATPTVAEGEADVTVQVGVLPGPDGQVCGGEDLLRLEIALAEPLGTRPILDGATGEAALVNTVDAPDLGEAYACGYAIGASPAPATESPAPATESPSPLVGTETVADDVFELTITTPRTTWSADEPIEVSASLAYLRQKPRTVAGLGGDIVFFEVEQLDGPVDTGPPSRETVCGLPEGFAQGDVQAVSFRKSGSWDPEGPLGSFWPDWFDDPKLRLPAGTYRIVADAVYGPVRRCDTETLDAALTIEVVDDTASDLVTDWGPLTVISQGGAPDAGLGPGTLSIGPDCVTFHGDGSRDDVGVTLAWPSEQTSWLPADRQIVFEHRSNDTLRLSDGDHVVFGGQGLGDAAAWLEKVWVQRPDPSCPADLWHVGEVLMVPRVELVNPKGRIRGERAVVRAERVLATRADYAGLYLDNERDGLPVYLFTGDLDSAIEQLRGSLGAVAAFEVREVERSSSELATIRQAITDATEELRRQGIDIVEIGTDVRRNEVFVGVLGKVDLASALISDYADARAFRVEKVGRPETA